MSPIPQIKNVMTPSPITTQGDTTVEAAQKLMIDNRIRHLPVVEGKRPIGILSDRDISLALLVNQGMSSAASLNVNEICTLHAFTVNANDTLDEVAFTMAQKQIGSALVVDDGALVGIFTATDACEYLGHCLRSKQ